MQQQTRPLMIPVRLWTFLFPKRARATRYAIASILLSLDSGVADQLRISDQSLFCSSVIQIRQIPLCGTNRYFRSALAPSPQRM